MAIINLRVRFTNSLSATEQISDLDVSVTDSTTTLFLKQEIRKKDQCSNKKLILIYNGRVLNETTDYKELFKRSDGSTIFVNCMIGEELTQEQQNEESNGQIDQPIPSTSAPVIGFDRLLLQGFTQQDINDLRLQFQSIYDMSSNRADINDLEEEESRQRLVQQMEERWIESTINNTQEPVTNTTNISERQPAPDIDDTSGNFDLLVGLLVGTFLGLLSLVFITVDDTIFNKRQKMAIIVGVSINVSFAILRGKWL